MTGDGPVPEPSGPPEEQGLADAFGHLQEAALAMVAAARSALDAAERLARDPAPLLDMVAEATGAARAQASPSGRAGGDGVAGATGPGQPSGRGSAPPRPRVQHVVVAPPAAATDGDDGDDEAGVGPAPR